MPKLVLSSAISSQGQATVPKLVRQFLGVEVGSRIIFRMTGRTVTLHPYDAKPTSEKATLSSKKATP